MSILTIGLNVTYIGVLVHNTSDLMRYLCVPKYKYANFPWETFWDGSEDLEDMMACA